MHRSAILALLLTTGCTLPQQSRADGPSVSATSAVTSVVPTPTITASSEWVLTQRGSSSLPGEHVSFPELCEVPFYEDSVNTRFVRLTQGQAVADVHMVKNTDVRTGINYWKFLISACKHGSDHFAQGPAAIIAWRPNGSHVVMGSILVGHKTYVIRIVPDAAVNEDRAWGQLRDLYMLARSQGLA